ncbi:MAG: ABC transporter permease [Chloroflexota bacterium]
MSSWRYAAKRLAWSIFALVGLSIVIFLLSRVIPGDPARMALGPRAPESVVMELREQMHLDEPLFVQYGYWLWGALHLDFGMSLVTMRPVLKDIQDFLPATMELVVLAAFLEISLGVSLGVLSAMFNRRWVDNLIRLIAYLGIVNPSFVFAVIFLLLFGYLWPILPAVGRVTMDTGIPRITGLITVDSLLIGNLDLFWDAVKHLILPALALAMNGSAQLARITRSSMVDNLSRDYVAMATAQGISQMKIMFKYLLRPSLIPSVSIMGLQFATLFSNAFLVELIFNWPGLSRYGVTAMLNKDLNAVTAVVLTVGLIFVLANIVTDIAVAALDPRIRLGAGREA